MGRLREVDLGTSPLRGNVESDWSVWTAHFQQLGAFSNISSCQLTFDLPIAIPGCLSTVCTIDLIDVLLTTS